MGLDAVELIFAVEDEFRVQIPDSDAANLSTPGALADYLATRHRRSASDPCPPQVGFYQLRKAIASEFGVSRREIRPTTLLRDLLADDMRSSWQRLQQAAGAKHFPRLRRQKPLFLSVVVAPPIAVGLMLLLSGAPVTWACTAGLVLYAVANRVTYNLGADIPPKNSAVASLVPYLTSGDATVWDREKILDRVKEITSKQMGIPKDKIDENDHFVKDLGIS